MALQLRVRRTRPRVYISDELLPEIIRRSQTTHVEEWSELVVWSRGIAKTSPAYRLRPERLPDRARRLAFMCAVRRDPKELELALELAPALAALEPTPAGVEALAQLYDSLRAVLPERLAQDCAASLAEGARRLHSERVRGRPLLSDARSEAIAAILAAGIALYGESPAAAELIGAGFLPMRDLAETMRFFLEQDGGFPLGWGASLPHAGALPKLALLAETGLGLAREPSPHLARYADFLEAGLRPCPPGAKGGPVWADGSSTGPRLADLWRVLAEAAPASPAARRLLKATRLPGCQDEKILFDARTAPADDAPAAPPSRPRAILFERAGVALFREPLDTFPAVEVVARCPRWALTGGEAPRPGSFSIAFGEDLVVAGADAPNGPIVRPTGGDAARAEARFPRTRRELDSDGFRISEIVGMESLGAALPAGSAVGFDLLVADLSAAHAAAAGSVVRRFMFMRGLPLWQGGALVVSDAVRLAAGPCEAMAVVHLAARPEIVRSAPGETCARTVRGGAALWSFVLLPPDAEVRLAEVPRPGLAQTVAWRLELVPPAAAGAVREGKDAARPGAPLDFCQVFFAGPAGGGAPRCGRLESEGAAALDVAGSALVLCGADARRVEAVSSGALRGIAVIGLPPSATVRLQVAGEEPVESHASALGAAFLPVRVPHVTGFVLECTPSTPQPQNLGGGPAGRTEGAAEDAGHGDTESGRGP